MINFLKFYKGKYKRILFTIKDADTNGPIDITSFTFDFTVKRSRQDPDSAAIFEKTSSSGISIIDGPNGKGQIDINASDTANAPLADQNVEWDLQIVRSGNPEIVAEGIGQILVPVTRAAS